MRCGAFERQIDRWLDRKLGVGEKVDFQTHRDQCGPCRTALESAQKLEALIKIAPGQIAPPRNFEALFWARLSERQKEPWILRIRRECLSLLPVPSRTEALAFALVAFIIGAGGGAISASGVAGQFEAERNSIQYLSGFREFKGMPVSSVSANYLRAIEAPATDQRDSA